MESYIESLLNVFHLVNIKSEQQKDKRMKMISMVIYNYILFMSKENNIDLKILSRQERINLHPIFEYISSNNIELYDFKTIDINDVDITKKNDLERFVLSHVYYLTQGI
jgi:hypothetical protein